MDETADGMKYEEASRSYSKTDSRFEWTVWRNISNKRHQELDHRSKKTEGENHWIMAIGGRYAAIHKPSPLHCLRSLFRWLQGHVFVTCLLRQFLVDLIKRWPAGCFIFPTASHQAVHVGRAFRGTLQTTLPLDHLENLRNKIQIKTPIDHFLTRNSKQTNGIKFSVCLGT